jgi:hypothetical protein
VKKNLSATATSTDYDNFDEFCRNINSFANDIDEFVRKIKEQQQRKTRQHRKRKIDEPLSDSNASPESFKLMTIKCLIFYFFHR